jgi:hypothetical protein
MTYTYTVTLDDLMRFGEHVYRTSDRVKRTKFWCCLLVPVFLETWALCYYWESRRFDWPFVFLTFQALASAIVLPRFFDRTSLKEIYRRCVMRPDADDSGSMQLVVRDDSVTEIAPMRKTTLAWTQVHKVDVQENRIYIYSDARSAIIIPRHTFGGDGTYADLQAEILKCSQKTNA